MQVENERQWKKVNENTYDIFPQKCVTKTFLEVSRCSRAKQRQRNVQKSVLHVQSCCCFFANNYRLTDFFSCFCWGCLKVVFMQSRETQITMVKWTNAGGQTKRANERSFVYCPPAWRRWRNVKTTYILFEPTINIIESFAFSPG